MRFEVHLIEEEKRIDEGKTAEGETMIDEEMKRDEEMKKGEEKTNEREEDPTTSVEKKKIDVRMIAVTTGENPTRKGTSIENTKENKKC